METTRNGHAPNGRSAPPDPTAGIPPVPAGSAPAGRSISLLPKSPVNGRESLRWWGRPMPPRSRFVPEAQEDIARLEGLLGSHPLRAQRLRMRLNAAVQASQAVEEEERDVEGRLEARQGMAAEAVGHMDGRVGQLLQCQADARAELAAAEVAFAAVAARARLLLADPLRPSPAQVGDALGRLVASGAEVAGRYALVPADPESDRPLAERLKEKAFEVATPISIGFLLGILILTATIGFRLSDMRSPDATLAIKLLVAQAIGMCTEFGLSAFGRRVAALVAMQRDGRAGEGQPDGRRDGLPVWCQAAFLVMCFAGLSVLEGIGLHDLHAQAARLSQSRDALPLAAYCLVGGVISGAYLGWQYAGECLRQTGQRRQAVQDYERRQERLAWLATEEGQEAIRLAHLIPVLRQRVLSMGEEIGALQADRAALAYPLPDGDTLALLDDHEEAARGERMGAMEELGELIEALEPLQTARRRSRRWGGRPGLRS